MLRRGGTYYSDPMLKVGASHSPCRKWMGFRTWTSMVAKSYEMDQCHTTLGKVLWPHLGMRDWHGPQMLKVECMIESRHEDSTKGVGHWKEIIQCVGDAGWTPKIPCDTIAIISLAACALDSPRLCWYHLGTGNRLLHPLSLRPHTQGANDLKKKKSKIILKKAPRKTLVAHYEEMICVIKCI